MVSPPNFESWDAERGNHHSDPSSLLQRPGDSYGDNEWKKGQNKNAALIRVPREISMVEARWELS